MTSTTPSGAVCSDCVTANGLLCERCAKSVLPQLAQPFWYQLVGTHHYTKTPTESPEGRAIRERKERRAAKRLLTGINGGFTRSTKAA